MKTLADFKREAPAKKFITTYTFRGEIPEAMKGERTVARAQTNAIQLMNEHGDKSWLDYPKATLAEYTGDTLKIYKAGYRYPNAEEQKALDEWEALRNTEEYQRNAEMDMLTDTNIIFWKKETFFDQRNMRHLLGHGYVKGMKLDYYRQRNGEPYIEDESIKGELSLVYTLLDK